MSRPWFDDMATKHNLSLFLSPCPLLSLASWCFRVSSVAVSRRTWCTPATETRTARLTRSHATAVSTAGCRNALRSACPRKVSPPGLESQGLERPTCKTWIFTLLHICVHRHTHTRLHVLPSKTQYDILLYPYNSSWYSNYTWLRVRVSFSFTTKLITA